MQRDESKQNENDAQALDMLAPAEAYNENRPAPSAHPFLLLRPRGQGNNHHPLLTLDAQPSEPIENKQDNPELPPIEHLQSAFQALKKQQNVNYTWTDETGNRTLTISGNFSCQNSSSQTTKKQGLKSLFKKK